MDCNLWNEKGLLFLANELDESEKQSFDIHMESCDFCQKEVALCQKEEKTIFKSGMFEEMPSLAVDKEILRVCSQAVKPAVGTFMMSSLFKNAFALLLVLLVGFGGGTYFAGIKAQSDARIAKQNNQKASEAMQDSASPSAVASSRDENGNPINDSILSEDGIIQRRGDMSVHGVVPVDLTNE